MVAPLQRIMMLTHVAIPAMFKSRHLNLDPLLAVIAFAGSSHVHISTFWRQHKTSEVGIYPSLCMCRRPLCLNSQSVRSCIGH